MRQRNKILVLVAVVMLIAILVAVVATTRRVAPANPPRLALDLGDGVTLELVLVQAGKFQMGSSEREPGHDPSEFPIHTVVIQKPFYLGRFEVTQGQWETVMKSSQAAFPGDPRRPAENMAWTDAQKFCRYASEKTGRKLRLPSEAEWEYACRAGSTTPWNTGGQLAEAVHKSAVGFKPIQPAPVGSRLPNTWGLHDMHGNVMEWCEDYFWPNHENAPANGSARTTPPPANEGDLPSRVYRGGSWRSNPQESRSAVRFAAPEDTRSDTMGFRVAMDAK
jgi:formylglycine-generating enzyme required for sulfatase activity